MTHRNFFLSSGDKIKTTEPAEITLIRFVGAGMIEVELKSDGDIEIEEHDPIREAVVASRLGDTEDHQTVGVILDEPEPAEPTPAKVVPDNTRDRFLQLWNSTGRMGRILIRALAADWPDTGDAE